MESETVMAHHHHHDDTYFLDQICMAAMSGAFGIICLSLYFVRQDMLFRLLAAHFHPFVLASGFALVGIAIVQSGRLWTMARLHKTRACGGVHQQESGENHTHSIFEHVHSHDHGGHGTGWAPWRYVVLLAPIFLYMLGLPNKGPSIDIHAIPEMDTSHELRGEFCYITSLTGVGANALAAFGVVTARHAADAAADEMEKVSVKQLIDMAPGRADREYYHDKMIRVRGQYAPRSKRYFELVRFRVNCCPGDAIQIGVPVIARDDIALGTKNIWVEVIGRVQFWQANGAFTTVVVVSNRNQVRPCDPELNPYLP